MVLKKKKVVIIGVTPPPVGGVSIHIARFIKILSDRETQFEVNLISPPKYFKSWKRFWLIPVTFSLLKHNAEIYHLHKPDHVIGLWYVLFLIALCGKRVIFTIHNENIADEISNGEITCLKRFSLRIIFKKFSHIICVNQRMAETLINEGIKEDRISVVPAFIPQEEFDVSCLPKNITQFVKSHSPVLVGYSHRVYLYQGFDRYGGDMMLEVVRRLRVPNPKIGVIIVIPTQNPNVNEGIQKYNEFIDENKLNENVLLCTDLVDLTALFSISDIHIRPSNTDGDPIAVRESLHLGIPTVASDCTYKPTGTVFHKDRDHDDFEKKVQYVIDSIEEEREKLNYIDKSDFAMAVIDIYDQVLLES